MVWSKELAKLKQGLKAKDALGGGVPAPAKQAAAPTVPKSLEEEDALFLTAVGKSISHPSAQKRAEERSHEGEFAKAMSQLKGIKPSGASARMGPKAGAASFDAPQSQKNEAAHAKVGADWAFGAPRPVQGPGAEAVGPARGDRGDGGNMGDMGKPEEIQLAAGMKIEVDGQLDIRNHSESDARERLAERVLDGQCLGWRSLHVILGDSDSLRQVLYGYLNSPQSAPLAKYAQAPVPMGGNKAWILYYHSHSTP